MPLRRRAFRPRRTIRRRRGYTGRRTTRSRRGYIVRRPRMSVNMHRFVRWDKTIDPTFEPMIINCSFPSSGISPASFNFRLSDVAAHAEFTALYDQYIIDKVVVMFDYSPDQASSVSNSAHVYPKLWVKRDYDDDATPTMTEMLQSNQTKCLRFTASRTSRAMVIRPAFANEVYRSATSTAYTTMRRQWLNCANDDVPHYGLKCIAQGLPSTNLGGITVRVKYFLRFKNVR